MAFIITGADAVSRQPTDVTFANLVDDALTSCGDPAVRSLEEPGKNTLMAMNAVNSACRRVWNANGWDWRINWVVLELDNGVTAYDLPGDYAWFNSPPVPIRRTIPAVHLTYENMLRSFPTFFEGPGGAFVGMSTEALIAFGLERNSAHVGLHKYWCIRGKRMVFYPAPVSTYYEDWDAESAFMMSYYSTYKKMSDTDDIVQLPDEVMNAVGFLALGYYKQGREDPDFQADEARGERLLSMAVARHRRVYPEDAYSQFRIMATPEGV